MDPRPTQTLAERAKWQQACHRHIKKLEGKATVKDIQIRSILIYHVM